LLKSEPETEIGLYKVFYRRINIMLAASDPIIVGLAKDCPMGTKPILEATPEVPEPAIVICVRRRIIERLIQLWKARVYRVSSPARENAAAAANPVWRQMNVWPEVIQRESQDDVSCDYARSRAE
jgi:hypothetical protein